MFSLKLPPLNLFTHECKIQLAEPQARGVILGDRYFRMFSRFVSMATRHACHHLKHRSHNMDSFYFYISNIHKYILCYYEISDIPILKYVQVNVFGTVFKYVYNDRFSWSVNGRRHVSSRWIRPVLFKTRKFMLSSRNTVKYVSGKVGGAQTLYLTLPTRSVCDINKTCRHIIFARIIIAVCIDIRV